MKGASIAEYVMWALMLLDYRPKAVPSRCRSICQRRAKAATMDWRGSEEGRDAKKEENGGLKDTRP